MTEVSQFDKKNGKIITASLKKPKLKHTAVPSQFPGCPVYFSKSTLERESPRKKRMRQEDEAVKKAEEDSIRSHQEYLSSREFHFLDELKHCVDIHGLPDKWMIFQDSLSINFLYIEIHPVPQIRYSVVVNNALNLRTYIGGIENYSFAKHIDNYNNVIQILEDISMLNTNTKGKKLFTAISLVQNILQSVECEVCSEQKNIFKNIQEQLSFFNHKKNSVRYNPETLVTSSLLFSISPSAYKFLYEADYIFLPHPSTIRRLCSNTSNIITETTENGFLYDIKQRFPYLEPKERHITLMMDEIHIKPFYDYKGGNILGKSFNSTECATSAYVFMVQSLLSPFKEVIHILPTKNITAAELHDILKKIILGLEKIGFCVVVVASDNNSINRKCMSLFLSPPQLNIVYPHPSDPLRPLFFCDRCCTFVKINPKQLVKSKSFEMCILFPHI